MKVASRVIHHVPDTGSNLEWLQNLGQGCMGKPILQEALNVGVFVCEFCNWEKCEE